MKAPEDLPRPELLEALAPLLELLELELRDVVTLHLGPRTVSARVVGRGPRGKRLHGVTVRRSHRIVDELED